MTTKRPTPSPFKPKTTTWPSGPPKPMPPSGSSRVSTHPSPSERVAVEGRKTQAKMDEIKRK